MENKRALVIIDMQNDYLWDKRKAMFGYDSKALTAAVNESIHRYNEEGCEIIYIGQIFPNIITNKWFIGFSIKGTQGAELYSGMDKISELYFEKNLPDTFTAKKFREYITQNGIREVILCGLDECGCVGATAKGAVKAGLKASIISAATGCRFDKAKQQKMHDKLISLGVGYI